MTTETQTGIIVSGLSKETAEDIAQKLQACWTFQDVFVARLDPVIPDTFIIGRDWQIVNYHFTDFAQLMFFRGMAAVLLCQSEHTMYVFQGHAGYTGPDTVFQLFPFPGGKRAQMGEN